MSTPLVWTRWPADGTPRRFWYQASATAVNAAQADVAAFTGGLAARVGVRAAHVAEADSRYVANEADSANLLAGVAHPVTCV